MSTRRQPRPWDRAKGESAKAYSYFQVYLRMPPTERSLDKVGLELGRADTTIDYFSRKWNWTERVADRMLERALQMLSWPIQEETVTEKTEITEDGQKLVIHKRIIRPVKWTTASRVFPRRQSRWSSSRGAGPANPA